MEAKKGGLAALANDGGECVRALARLRPDTHSIT